MTPPKTREQRAQEVLDATPHSHCPAWSNSFSMPTEHKCICDRSVRAIIAAEDAERERCAGIAQSRADGIKKYALPVVLALLIALPDAIRNPEGGETP